MTTSPDIDKAADFVWRHARLVDRLRFAHHFLDGAAAPVVAAVAAYQNADGGFGNALEPDLRAPTSQPVPVQSAFEVLAEVGAMADPMVPFACDWLITVTTAEGGVPFVLPTAREYPRAPWWQPVDDPPAQINPTGAIAGLLLAARIEHAWLEPGAAFCRKVIAASTGDDPHDLLCMLSFLEGAGEPLPANLGDALRRIVVTNPATEGYVKMPLDFAPRATSLARELWSDDVFEAHLDALVAKQQDDGGWPITWEPPSQAAVSEWRGLGTVHALLTLRSWGRLP